MKKRCSSGKKGRGFFGRKGEREGEEKKERKRCNIKKEGKLFLEERVK